MDARKVIIGLTFFLITVCVCPILLAVVVTVIDNLPQGGATDIISTLFLLAICAGPVLLAFFGLGWQLRHIFRSRSAGRRLAEALGWKPLNESTKEMAVWYGSKYLGRQAAIKPFGSTYRYYAMERSRIGVKFLLRIVMEVKVPQPLGIVVYRDRKKGGDPQTFEDAFDEENGSRLTSTAQAAMLAFVQKGYPTGLQGVSYRFSKGTRNLRLRDRATAPDGLLAAEVIPDAHVILVYDHPDTTISPEELTAVLDEMAVVVQAIE